MPGRAQGGLCKHRLPTRTMPLGALRMQQHTCGPMESRDPYGSQDLNLIMDPRCSPANSFGSLLLKSTLYPVGKRDMSSTSPQQVSMPLCAFVASTEHENKNSCYYTCAYVSKSVSSLYVCTCLLYVYIGLYMCMHKVVTMYMCMYICCIIFSRKM